MNQEMVAKAEEFIKSKTAEVNMGAGVTLSLIDHEGYPTTSTLSISKADGIREILFGVALDSNKAKRASACSRASVCIFDDDFTNDAYYNITLVGDIEIVTDPETKKDVWYKGLEEHFTDGANDPNYCVLRFTTRRYNLFVGYESAEGTLKDAEGKTSMKKTAPVIELMLPFAGNCEGAIELYKDAFGAKLTYLGHYSDTNPQDRPSDYNSEKHANLIFHAQMMIGDQCILLWDSLSGGLPKEDLLYPYPVATFKTADEVKAAYNVLADGATIVSPMSSATYSACGVSLIDKFGIYWDLMTEK